MRKVLLTPILLLIPLISFSQKTRKDTLKTGEILVVKPYTPTILDAFKVKSNPTEKRSDNSQKEKVNYSIYSIPVASTFTSSKGKVKGVARVPKERLYENYISAGFGNYFSPFFQTFLNVGDSRYHDVGIFVNYKSSDGGIQNSLLDANYSDANIELNYKQFDRDFNWQINGGYERNRTNYYGLPSTITFTEEIIDAMDEKQVYNTIYLGGNIHFEDSFFESATVEFTDFFDYYNSNELRILIKPRFEFPISSEMISVELLADGIHGKFNTNYTETDALNYTFLKTGLLPSFTVYRDKFILNLGVKLFYSTSIEEGKSAFYAYPNVTASLKVVDDIFILIAGATGDLVQNNYKDFTRMNPYVSPTLDLRQTDEQYKAFIGAKGKLASNIGYNLNVSYSNEVDKAFFIQNQTQTEGTLAVSNAYQAGNSFGIIYDELKSLDVFGEITLDISKELNISGSVNYANYTTENIEEAWNIPTVKATIWADYKNDDWFVGGKLFFQGNTKDYVIPYGELSENGTIITNDSFVDLNFYGGYNFTDRLTAFAKINNALNVKYYNFVNYQVQEIQVLGGITYKFDL